MIRRLLDWLIGRREPRPDFAEKEARLRSLEIRAQVVLRGRR